MHAEWWHWIVGGIILVLAELAIPAFYIIWFGCGALLVGLALVLLPNLSSTAQVMLWIVTSATLTALWFRVLRAGRSRTRSGTADGDAIGEAGLVVQAIAPFARGRVRFQRPILGADEWACSAETEIPAGERVRIVAIEGSYLKVVKS